MKFFVVLLVALVQANAHFNHEEAKERFTQRFGEINADKVKELVAKRREQLANINIEELKSNILNRLQNRIESIDQEEIKANLEEVFSRLRPERRRRDAESEKPTEEVRHPRFSQKGRFNPKDFIAQRREELSKVNIEELRDNILSRLPELKTRVENLDKDEIKANLEEVFQRLRSERHRRDVSAEEEVETVEVEKKEKPQRPQGRPERRERPEGPKGPKPQVEKKEKPQGRPERRERTEETQGRPERRRRDVSAEEEVKTVEVEKKEKPQRPQGRPERRERPEGPKGPKPQVEKKEKPQVEKKEKPQVEKKEKPQGRPERRERPEGPQGRPERRERPQGNPEFANIFNRIPEQLKAQLENIDKDELKANLHEVFGFLRPESRHRRDATEEQVEEVETVAVQVEKKEKPQGRPERRERPEGAKGPKAHHERREGPHAERHPEAAKAHAQRRPEGPQGRPERREGPHARPEGFKAHPERREGPHAHPRPQAFGPRPQGFGPRPQGFGPRPQGFGPRPQVEETVQPQVPQ